MQLIDHLAVEGSDLSRLRSLLRAALRAGHGDRAAQQLMLELIGILIQALLFDRLSAFARELRPVKIGLARQAPGAGDQ